MPHHRRTGTGVEHEGPRLTIDLNVDDLVTGGQLGKLEDREALAHEEPADFAGFGRRSRCRGRKDHGKGNDDKGKGTHEKYLTKREGGMDGRPAAQGGQMILRRLRLITLPSGSR